MFILFLLLLSIPLAFSQIHQAGFDLSTRYDNIDHGKNEERLQERIRVDAEGNLTPSWQVKTLLATGETYTSLWSTYYNFRSEGDNDQNFNVRQLYGEFQSSKEHLFQLGIIPPYREYLRTGMKSTGWVEGGSYSYLQNRFRGNVSAGSVDDVDQPSVLSRTRSFNYGAVNAKYKLSEYLNTQVGASILDHEEYLQWEISSKPFEHVRDGLELTIESLMNLEESVRNISFAATTYPFLFSNPELKDYLNLQLAHYYIDENIGTLGTLSDDFYTFGSTWFVGAKGKITENNQFSWLLKYWDNDVPRFSIGLMYKYEWDSK